MIGVKPQGSEMKISRDDVIRNRKQILLSAARLFREHGFNGVNVAQIMSASGLTHGAFYGYFNSKDDLIAQMLANLLLPPPEGASDIPDEDIRFYSSAYLSGKHRDAPGNGCPYAALGSEIARAPKEIRKVMTKAVHHRIDRLSATASGRTERHRRRNAIAGWSAMIGALLLSRIVDEPRLSNEILRETLASLKF
jgi:TetR/AcrR family transcriptional regulator, transcriptional repressor for nem operon